MSRRNALQAAFDRFGTENGFEKKSGSWYRRSDEVIAVSNLQKSQYGPQYYFNQGFWLRELNDVRYPRSNEAHIVARLEDLVPEVEQRLGELLDLECEMSDEQRIGELVALLGERLLPLIERAVTIAGLRTLIDDGTFAAAGIRGPAQAMLGILAE